MDKRLLLDRFMELLQADLSTLTQAAAAAHDAATHTESKAEDQYDTRGLEASYLAGAQSKRVIELEESLNIYKHVDIKEFNPKTPIASTAVIELECNSKPLYYLLMPTGGGMKADFDGKIIHVITPQSPLGEALLGKKVGDQIEVKIQNILRDYDIIGIS